MTSFSACRSLPLQEECDVTGHLPVRWVEEGVSSSERTILRDCIVSSPFGPVRGVKNEKDVWVSISFEEEGSSLPEARIFLNCSTANRVRDESLSGELLSLFQPEKWSAMAPIAIQPEGTAFEKRVWQALLDIPTGQTLSYKALALGLGQPGASRAVGRAVGKNSLAFVIPCHRIVGSDGRLCGYRWGPERKKAMLDWERSAAR
jgi:AraC family transcriptional regulator of adaptative response/methylated-DNA-[protein]-cysteine methyltransferase